MRLAAACFSLMSNAFLHPFCFGMVVNYGMIAFRLAIKSSQAPAKRPRMASPHAQIEELESVKYLVESVSMDGLLNSICLY